MAMEIGTMHSSLQHFCLLLMPHTSPPGALGEVDTASVHNAPFTVKHAAVAPQHLQNLLKEADKHSLLEVRSVGCIDKNQISALCFREFHFSKNIHEMKLQQIWEDLNRSSSSVLRLFFIFFHQMADRVLIEAVRARGSPLEDTHW